MKNLFNAGFGYGRVFPLKTKKLINTVKNYFRFVAVEDSSILLSSFNLETMGPDNTLDLLYSKDGKLWTQYDFNAIPLNAGETLYMKGNNPNGVSNKLDFETGTGRVYSFGNLFEISGDSNSTTGKYECYGNIMSLLYGDDFEGKDTIPSEYCFDKLFLSCTGLTTAPELPATKLTYSCYSSMFSGCTRLTTAPALPATTLASNCYESMFHGCTSLTTAPELPAPILTSMCYSCMFWHCISLNHITMLATDISAQDNYCFDNWLTDVAPTGTFIKHPDIDVDSFYYISEEENPCIPEGWTVVDYI